MDTTLVQLRKLTDVSRTTGPDIPWAIYGDAVPTKGTVGKQHRSAVMSYSEELRNTQARTSSRTDVRPVPRSGG